MRPLLRAASATLGEESNRASAKHPVAMTWAPREKKDLHHCGSVAEGEVLSTSSRALGGADRLGSPCLKPRPVMAFSRLSNIERSSSGAADATEFGRGTELLVFPGRCTGLGSTGEGRAARGAEPRGGAPTREISRGLREVIAAVGFNMMYQAVLLKTIDTNFRS
mmetsp:Transcript_14943/g.41983  ORF Transcript_14943/g.41983 Transcript_14943/m.41983 type:complete len:165 (+) Transcript_14943:1245-1739(+)